MSEREVAAPPARARLTLRPALTSLACGALAVLGFAPFGWWPLTLLLLSVVFLQWASARSAALAFKLGWLFGLGFFLAGVSWTYVSMHDFGAMPLPLAALATLLFCAFLALFPAVSAWLTARGGGTATLKLLLAAPAAWTLTEWVRGWIFTGFPWNAIGYSQMVASPLAGYAPVLGIFGVSLALAAMAGCAALLTVRWTAAKPRHRSRALLRHPAPYVFAILALGGGALQAISWTEPTGTAATVSLLQGNVAQDMKWREDQLIKTLQSYLAQVRASRAQLIVLPETALPLFLHQVPPDYLDALREQAVRNQGDILIGVTEREPDGRYYNSAVSLGVSPPQKYRKSHLVPFGEFIPLRPLLAWIVNVLVIPLQDFSRGAIDQQPLAVAGQRVAVNICYEDAFGEEIARQLPQATLLVNISNVAWFGRSLAPAQHLQISQARALETGRYMLRATNTGMTAVIDQRGRVLSVATPFTMATVDYTVPGYKGTTPYVRWGNSLVLAMLAIMLVASGGLAPLWRRDRAQGDENV